MKRNSPQLRDDLTKRRMPVDLRAVVDKIERSYRAGRPLDITQHTPAKWATAAAFLFRVGRLEAAEYAARQLHTEYPNFRWAKLVCRFCNHMPPIGDQLPFSDDTTKDVQIVRRDGSDTVLLLFCDMRHHLNLPLVAMHRWFGRLPASLIYLRDFRQLLFLPGVGSLAPTRLGTVSALRDIISSLGTSRVLSFGNSTGVFPALHYGLDLGARAVLGMAGPVTLSREFHAQSPAGPYINLIAQHFPECLDLDMRKAYGQAESPPRVRLVYGADAAYDRRHAEHMQPLPGVELQALDGYGEHDALIESASRGLLPSMLNWLVEQR